MKLSIAIIAVTFIGLSTAQHIVESSTVCRDDVDRVCEKELRPDLVACNSTMSGFKHVQNDLLAYINSQLATSYDYLLLSAYFNSYQKNRPGFEKLFRKLSDRSFEKSIDLIKHVTKRGGAHSFYVRHDIPSTATHEKRSLEVDEFRALAIALDSEKKLSNDAHHIHRRSLRHDNHEHYDPEIAQYIEEEFLEYQADSIRKLSGYTNDIWKIMKSADKTLGIYLFDEYLQKQF